MVKTLISCIKNENSNFSSGLKELSSVVEFSFYIRAVRGSNPLVLINGVPAAAKQQGYLNSHFILIY